MTPIDRRTFLRSLAFGSGAVGLGACGGGRWAEPQAGIPRPTTTTTTTELRTTGTARRPAVAAPEPRNRTLVVIELEGGNDGIATVVPYADPAYPVMREQLGFTADQLHLIDDEVGLHPRLEGLAERPLAVVEGVGMADPDLSHFESMRRWWSGDAEGSGQLDGGFLGRCCDVLADGQPVVGMTLGWGPTPGLVTRDAGTMALPDPEAAGAVGGDDEWLAPWRQGLEAMAAAEPSSDATLLSVAHRGLRDMLEFAEVVANLPEAPDGYPETDLGSRLALASRIIQADIGVRVLHVPHGGFDTHDEQAGFHDQLIGELDAGMTRFLDDMADQGRGGEVLVATYSEFGRRPDENGGGTDHGTASVMLLAGPVHAGRHGEYPRLTRLDETDNLVTSVLMRDYYATLAESWLGIPATDVLPTGATPLDGVIAA